MPAFLGQKSKRLGGGGMGRGVVVAGVWSVNGRYKSQQLLFKYVQESNPYALLRWKTFIPLSYSVGDQGLLVSTVAERLLS